MSTTSTAGVVAAVTGAFVLAVPVAALADGKFRADLVGRPVGVTTPIAGVPAGGLPWVVADGSAARVRAGADGSRFQARVEGLLITDAPPPREALNGTTGGVPAVAASLVCDGAVAVTTSAAPLSAAGDARIDDRDVAVPAACGSPVVLVRVFRDGAPGAWIAATGL